MADGVPIDIDSDVLEIYEESHELDVAEIITDPFVRMGVNIDFGDPMPAFEPFDDWLPDTDDICTETGSVTIPAEFITSVRMPRISTYSGSEMAEITEEDLDLIFDFIAEVMLNQQRSLSVSDCFIQALQDAGLYDDYNNRMRAIRLEGIRKSYELGFLTQEEFHELTRGHFESLDSDLDLIHSNPELIDSLDIELSEIAPLQILPNHSVPSSIQHGTMGRSPRTIMPHYRVRYSFSFSPSSVVEVGYARGTFLNEGARYSGSFASGRFYVNINSGSFAIRNHGPAFGIVTNGNYSAELPF
jgi:hypothetical protein